VNLTDEDVREILRLLDESPYDELKLETDRFKLTLRKSGETSWMRKGAPMQAFEPQAPGPRSPEPRLPEPRSRAPAGPAVAAPAVNGEIRDIRPPMPGTFYRAPSPGAEPFTAVGRTVTENTILGLVETMKLMNSVMAGCRGEVVEICAGNGAAVEVEDTLVRIRVAPNA
jgi:acetyl-CoA carboxylase biotin carboxyl carrier protein